VGFRILVLYLDSNTYAFTIMLATVLAGIAAGSYLATPLMRWAHRSLVPLAMAELAIALAALLSVYLLSQTYDVADSIGRIVGTTSGTNLRFMLLASALAILPTTVLMGLAFPIGLYIFAGTPDADDPNAGRSVGTFYACNVAGGIVGSVLTGFVLVPQLGARRSIILLATILLGSGLALATIAGRRRARLGMAGGATALFVALTALAVPDPYSAALDHRYAGERVLWFDEGEQTTVSIHEGRGGRLMYLDGLIQANDSKPVVRFHTRIGSLPSALHARPKEALVIGLGGGVTAGAVGAQPEVDVDIVELSANVVQGATFLSDVNRDVVKRHNVRIRVDDARNYLLLTDKRYDVITADIIQPHHAGAGKLWSVEYWELVRDALDDDGIMLQWVPYRRAAEYKMILRSFLKVFPDATLWSNGSMLIGTKKPLALQRRDFAEKLATPESRSILAAAGVTSFESLLTLYTAGPSEIRSFVGPGPLLTDDHPRIEYSSDPEPPTVFAPSFISRLNGDVRDILVD
jgi:spermidine synthase